MKTTPLYLVLATAIKENDFERYKQEIEKVNQLPEFDINCLFLSVSRSPEKVEYFSLLVQKIEEVDFLECHQGLPLFAACEFNLIKEAKILLKKGVDPNLCGARSLAKCFENNNKELAELLISYGANVKLAAQTSRPKHISEYLKIQNLSKKNKIDN